MQNLIRDGKDEDSGASLELPKPQNYSALDIWAYNSAEELKVCNQEHIQSLQCSEAKWASLNNWRMLLVP